MQPHQVSDPLQLHKCTPKIRKSSQMAVLTSSKTSCKMASRNAADSSTREPVSCTRRLRHGAMTSVALTRDISHFLFPISYFPFPISSLCTTTYPSRDRQVLYSATAESAVPISGRLPRDYKRRSNTAPSVASQRCSSLLVKLFLASGSGMSKRAGPTLIGGPHALASSPVCALTFPSIETMKKVT